MNILKERAKSEIPSMFLFLFILTRALPNLHFQQAHGSDSGNKLMGLLAGGLASRAIG